MEHGPLTHRSLHPVVCEQPPLSAGDSEWREAGRRTQHACCTEPAFCQGRRARGDGKGLRGLGGVKQAAPQSRWGGLYVSKHE